MGLAKVYDYDFEYFFWEPYPKHVGKAQAEKEFLKIGFTPEQKCELKAYITKRKGWDQKWKPNKEGKTFIVDPERFLKHRRFEDEPEYAASIHEVRDRVEAREPPPPPVDRAASERAAQIAFTELRGLLH